MMPLGSAPLLADWPGDAADNRADGALACAVANQIVGLLRKHAGRGPTKAKCAITTDLVVVTLADCLTTLETQLAGAGNRELVRRVRRAIHQGMRSEATAIVEALTQRRVVAYLTAQDHDPDLAVLIFYLARPEPTASNGSGHIRTRTAGERRLPAESARRNGEPRSTAARTRSRRPVVSFSSGGWGWLGSLIVSAVAALMLLLLLSVGLLD